MLVYVHGAKCVGIEAVPVTVEVDITLGIGIHLCGLADAAVKESLLRTVTALQAKGFRIPGKKIVNNLSVCKQLKQMDISHIKTTLEVSGIKAVEGGYLPRIMDDKEEQLASPNPEDLPNEVYKTLLPEEE
jgi:hypothetical protein